MKKFSVVTTFNEKGFEISGKKMIDSFDKFWSKDIQLNVYYEDMSQPKLRCSDRIIFYNFNDEVKKWYKFKQKFFFKELIKPDNSSRSFYIYSASKFAHKVYAMQKQIEKKNCEYLIWLDSDTVTYKKLDSSFLNSLINRESYLTYLGRDHLNFHSETGFMIFNTKNKFHEIFWDKMMKMYDEGELFKEKEWHDCWIFDTVRKELEKKSLKNIDICFFGLKNDDPNKHNVFDNSVLGEYMTHFKGNRKYKIQHD
jgi:hypothetical protein